MRFIPAAVTPVFLDDIVISAASNEGWVDRFEAQLAAYFSQNHAFTFTSLMRTVYACFVALRSTSDRRVVILPRYSCPSFVHGVSAAGLVVEYCDVDPLTLAIDIESLKSLDLSRALALVCTNLFGLTSDIDQLLDIGRTHGMYVVEGVDYGIGTEYKSKRIGAWSSIAILNFQEGKAFPIGGGAIVSSLPVFENMFGSNRKTCLPNIITMLGFSIFSRPRMYFLFMKLSQMLRIERKNFSMEDTIRNTTFETDFEFDARDFDRRLSNFQGKLGCRIMARIKKDMGRRQEIVNLLDAALRKFPDVHIITKTAKVSNVHYIRCPFLVGAGQRDLILAKLLSHGIEASPMYVEHGMRVDAESYPGSARVANELLTLPCHPYMDNDDIDVIAQIFNSHFLGVA
jgi:dTDP-4-amino-4,6-dideoxygalactose transaminase